MVTSFDQQEIQDRLSNVVTKMMEYMSRKDVDRKKMAKDLKGSF